MSQRRRESEPHNGSTIDDLGGGRYLTIPQHGLSNAVTINPVSIESGAVLTLRVFSRKGFRVWYLFPTASDEESTEWLARLGTFTTSPHIARGFEAVVQTTGYVVVLRATDRKLRIAANPVERLENLDLGSTAVRALPRSLPHGQREALLRQLRDRGRVLASPQFAVMIDVDVFVDNPVDVNAADFARHSLALVEHRLPAALEAH